MKYILLKINSKIIDALKHAYTTIQNRISKIIIISIKERSVGLHLFAVALKKFYIILQAMANSEPSFKTPKINSKRR